MSECDPTVVSRLPPALLLICSQAAAGEHRHPRKTGVCIHGSPSACVSALASAQRQPLLVSPLARQVRAAAGHKHSGRRREQSSAVDAARKAGKTGAKYQNNCRATSSLPFISRFLTHVHLPSCCVAGCRESSLLLLDPLVAAAAAADRSLDPTTKGSPGGG